MLEDASWTPFENLWDVLETIINTNSWRQISAAVDGSKCCDVAEAYRSDPVVNACRNQS